MTSPKLFVASLGCCAAYYAVGSLLSRKPDNYDPEVLRHQKAQRLGTLGLSLIEPKNHVMAVTATVAMIREYKTAAAVLARRSYVTSASSHTTT